MQHSMQHCMHLQSCTMCPPQNGCTQHHGSNDFKGGMIRVAAIAMDTNCNFVVHCSVSPSLLLLLLSLCPKKRLLCVILHAVIVQCAVLHTCVPAYKYCMSMQLSTFSIFCRGYTSSSLLWSLWQVQRISHGTSGTKLGGFV